MSNVGASARRAGVFGTAVANTNAIQILASTTGSRFRVRGLILSASVSGRYQVYDNGTGNPLIYDGHLLANTPFVVPIPGDGYVGAGTATASGTITFLNASGGAADMAATLFYDMLTP